jgi:hypothetical protein
VGPALGGRQPPLPRRVRSSRPRQERVVGRVRVRDGRGCHGLGAPRDSGTVSAALSRRPGSGGPLRNGERIRPGRSTASAAASISRALVIACSAPTSEGCSTTALCAIGSTRRSSAPSSGTWREGRPDRLPRAAPHVRHPRRRDLAAPRPAGLHGPRGHPDDDDLRPPCAEGRGRDELSRAVAAAMGASIFDRMADMEGALPK